MTPTEIRHESDENLETNGLGLNATAIAIFLRKYALPILLGITACAIAYALLSLFLLLTAPNLRTTTLGFRLEFVGAERNQYPNGLPFRSGDIVDSAILRIVYDSNNLKEYMGFAEFTNSVVVLESNAALQQLAREYEAKLADPKLAPIERIQLENEYAQKRENFRKNDYALTFVNTEGLARVPSRLTAKTLVDILRIWSEHASRTRHVMVYRVPLVSSGALTNLHGTEPDLLAGLLALRATAVEMQNNVDWLSSVPGAELVRSMKRGASLRELTLELSEIQRGSIEFLIDRVVKSGVIEPSRAAATIEARLEHDLRELAAIEDRVGVLRAALDDYSRNREDRPGLMARGTSKAAPSPSEDGVQPQLSDTFLERIVSMAQDAADREYRQSKANEIMKVGIEAVPIRALVEYERGLLALVRSGPRASLPQSASDLAAERTRITARMAAIATDLTEIRTILSSGLTGSGQIYTITSPAATVIERSVSLRRLILGGILVMLLATVVAVALAFFHFRLMIERAQSQASASPVP
jgi:hypothetical protein